jgi:hypothetical protein
MALRSSASTRARSASRARSRRPASETTPRWPRWRMH